LAQGSISAFSWGENVAIYVEDVAGKVKTRVEVVNKRALSVNITAADWESKILEELDKRL
jgi:predicted thioesterase